MKIIFIACALDAYYLFSCAPNAHNIQSGKEGEVNMRQFVGMVPVNVALQQHGRGEGGGAARGNGGGYQAFRGGSDGHGDGFNI